MIDSKHPVLFVGHGAPTLAIDAEKGAPFRAWSQQLERPRAILVISAHWEESPLTLGESVRHEDLIYDFYGFPPALSRVQYPAPPDAELGQRVMALTNAAPSQRGLDHGVWTPLVHLYPEADVPVMQLSMPRSMSDAQLVQLGQSLAPLRDEGVLIIGSGNITHNLRRLEADGSSPEAWAEDFDRWTAETLEAGDPMELCKWIEQPGARLCHPTPDHWRPLLVAAGAAAGASVKYPVLGYEYGNLSRRSVEFS